MLIFRPIMLFSSVFFFIMLFSSVIFYHAFAPAPIMLSYIMFKKFILHTKIT